MVPKKIPPTFKKDHFERLSWDQSTLICGVDEVGRGCLAGPVVVAAAILPPYTSYRLLKDSKIMTIEERERAFNWIQRKCIYSWVTIHHRIVDRYNIYYTTLIAMKRAVMQLSAYVKQMPKIVLVDAMPLSLNNTALKETQIIYFPKGEHKSRSIAAASIIAKIKRDALMRKMSILFPHFGFAQHKGYSTTQHKKAIHVYGKLVIHRKQFIKKIVVADHEYSAQSRLC